MKNVKAIIAADFRALFRQLLPTVIVVAILFIPALYAWFNIYANWDPYGNTGNITIAVASDDEGCTDLNGDFVNMGETVLESLAAKDTINFVVYEDSNEALQVMESGKAYAAIILNKDFSRNMYDLANALRNPGSSMTYYENYKLNAVANKITESAASTVNQTVQTQYLEVLFETVFAKIGDITEDVDIQESEESLLHSLSYIRETCEVVDETCGYLITLCDGAVETLEKVDTTGVVSTMDTLQGTVESTTAALENADWPTLFTEMFDAVLSIPQVSEAVDNVNNQIDENIDDETQQQLTDIAAQMRSQAEELYALAESLQSSADQSGDSSTEQMIEDIRAQADTLISESEMLSSAVQTIDENMTPEQKENLSSVLTLISENYSSLSSFVNSSVVPYFTARMNLSTNLLKKLWPVLYNLGVTYESLTPVAHSGAATLASTSEMLTYLQTAMEDCVKALDDVIDAIRDLSETELVETLIDVLGGNAEDFAEFFSCPVTVHTNAIYPVATYGTAMAPFYSTLAIWVGCVVLAAVVKVEAKPRELKNVTDAQLYWSRFLIYLLLNEIQTFVIIAGDLWLLGISCVNVPALFFCAAVTSFVFTAFIYSMVLSFGDIGKAIVVVIMVLQIAGSSGTYPIEILSDMYEKIYLMFPFPYAINAEREAIAGMYGADMFIYLGELLIFGAIGIIIGLFVRRPFMEMTEFIEEEMEETGVF